MIVRFQDTTRIREIQDPLFLWFQDFRTPQWSEPPSKIVWTFLHFWQLSNPFMKEIRSLLYWILHFLTKKLAYFSWVFQESSSVPILWSKIACFQDIKTLRVPQSSIMRSTLGVQLGPIEQPERYQKFRKISEHAYFCDFSMVVDIKIGKSV